MLSNRWNLALAGVLLGFVDLWFAHSTGIRFDINGRDASLVVLTYLAFSFGGLGYLLGYLLELRRKEQQNALLIQDQLAALEEIRERLAQNEKLASLGQLASAIAHELRNPLAIIRSTVQNLEEDLPPEAEEAQESCGFVREEIDRLSRVTATLLDFSRPLRPRPQPLRVEDLFERVTLLSKRLLAPRRLRLESHVAEALRHSTAASPMADPDLTCQVLLGLLDNAAQVTPEGGVVRLSASEDAEDLTLSVSDGGPGVPDELRGQIFEPFFTTRGQGTGLGLAVARQIAKAHGGHLEVDDGPLGGARFTLRLPVSGKLSEAA